MTLLELAEQMSRGLSETPVLEVLTQILANSQISGGEYKDLEITLSGNFHVKLEFKFFKSENGISFTGYVNSYGSTLAIALGRAVKILLTNKFYFVE
jgi:hypothetical protein